MKKVVLQVYCRVEVIVEDAEAVTELAVEQLRAADIDWAEEPDTFEEAAGELRGDLARALAAVVDPERMLEGVPGVEVRRGRWWAEHAEAEHIEAGRTEAGYIEAGRTEAENAEAEPRFQPGFTLPD